MKKIVLSEHDKAQIEIFGESINKIIHVTCDYFRITPEQMGARDRNRIPAKARRIAMKLCRELVPSCPLYIVGYIINPNDPYDHATVRVATNKLDAELYEKTAMGRYMNVSLRSDHQIVHANAVYELSKFGEIDTEKGKISAWIGRKTNGLMINYCKNTGMSKSLFIKTAIINELKRVQNGIQVQ